MSSLRKFVKKTPVYGWCWQEVLFLACGTRLRCRTQARRNTACSGTNVQASFFEYMCSSLENVMGQVDRQLLELSKGQLQHTTENSAALSGRPRIQPFVSHSCVLLVTAGPPEKVDQCEPSESASNQASWRADPPANSAELAVASRQLRSRIVARRRGPHILTSVRAVPGL